MDNRTLLKTGIIGSVVAAICCVTPILLIALGALGLSAWIGWLDYVLIPALLAFLGLTVHAWRRHRAACAAGARSCDDPRRRPEAPAAQAAQTAQPPASSRRGFK